MDSVQQKVRADRLPHVVCLKCDPNEVTAFFSKSLDTSEQLHRINSVKANLQWSVSTCIVIFNTDTSGRASCVFAEHGVYFVNLYSPCLSHCSGLHLWQDGAGLQQAGDAEWKHGNWESLGVVHNRTVSVLPVFCARDLWNGCVFATGAAWHSQVNMQTQFQMGSIMPWMYCCECCVGKYIVSKIPTAGEDHQNYC